MQLEARGKITKCFAGTAFKILHVWFKSKLYRRIYAHFILKMHYLIKYDDKIYKISFQKSF